MRIKEFFKQKIAPLLKKRLLIPTVYVTVGLCYTHDVHDCLTRIVIANTILACILLTKPKLLFSFDSVVLVLFLLWMSRTNDNDMKKKCENPTKNLFLEASIRIFELFIDFFTFYMIFLGIAVIFQILRAIWQTGFHEDTSDAEENPAGLTPVELGNLEVKTYSHHVNSSADGSTEGGTTDEELCSICISAYQLEEKIIVIPGCKHMFHENCIKDWLKTLAVCPYCRRNVRSGEVPSSSTDQELGQNVVQNLGPLNAENQRSSPILIDQGNLSSSGVPYSVLNNQSCEMVTFDELENQRTQAKDQDTIHILTD